MHKPHIALSHAHFQTIINRGDIVIDATCGNGHDTLFLAKLLFKENQAGTLYAIDLQASAIANCKERLTKEYSLEIANKVIYCHQSHSTFPQAVLHHSVKLIVYNLGYLPGGNKTLTTLQDTTCESIKNALVLICKNGSISITCYPGHAAGKVEEEAVLNLAKQLDYKEWSCCHHRFLNRENSPSLLILTKL